MSNCSLRKSLMASAALIVVASGSANAQCVVTGSDMTCIGNNPGTSVLATSLDTVTVDNTGVYNQINLANVDIFLNEGEIGASNGFSSNFGVTYQYSAVPYSVTSFSNTGTIRGGDGRGFNLSSNVSLGSFNNAGFIFAPNDNGVFIGGEISGDFTNSGTIESGSDGIFFYQANLGGNFTNTGTITAIVNGLYLHGSAGGNVTNGGTINAGANGIYITGAVTGDVINTGTITADVNNGIDVGGDVGGSVDNSGDITAGFAGIEIRGSVTGDVLNSGTITSTEGGIHIAGDVGGNIDNSGTITSDNSIGIHVGGDVGGSLTNSGYITAHSIGIDIRGSVTGDVMNNGTIDNDTEALMITGSVGGDFTNTGTLTSTNFRAVTIWGNVDGDVINSGNVSGFSSGILIGGNVGGSVNNSSQITSGERGLEIGGNVTGDIINSGTIDVNSGIGILVFGDVGGDFINSGDISSDSSGIETFGTIYGNVLNSGTIDARRGGFYLSQLSGNFTNTGTINSTSGSGVSVDNVSGSFSNTGSIIAAYHGIFLITLDGTFYNDGLIESLGAASYPCAVDIGFHNDDFVNDVNGTLTGANCGVWIASFGGDVFRNDGTISATSSTIAAANHGVEITTDGSSFSFINTGQISSVLGDGVLVLGNTDNVINTGQIMTTGGNGMRFVGDVGQFLNEGSITGGSGAGLLFEGANGTILLNTMVGFISGATGVEFGIGGDLFENHGIVTGTTGLAIDMGEGDDTLLLTGNSIISGDMDGGADYDTLEIAMDFTLDMEVRNFERFNMYSGSTITFGMDQTIAKTYNYGGTLDLGAFTLDGSLYMLSGMLIGNGGSITGDVVNLGNIMASNLDIQGNLTTAGLVSPGGTGSIGTLTIQGDFTALTAGSILNTPRNALGNEGATAIAPGDSLIAIDFIGTSQDTIMVGGSAILAGDIVLLGDFSEAIRSRASYEILTASGGVSGSLNLLNTPGVLFTPTLGYSSNAVAFSFETQDFTTALGADTFNQSNAALGLQDRWNMGASAVDDVILALNNGAEAAPILNAYSPETSAALTRHTARQSSTLANTIAACASGSTGIGCGDRTTDGSRTVWTHLSVGSTQIDTDMNAGQVDEELRQMTYGFEYSLADGFTAGGFLSAGKGHVVIGEGASGRGTAESTAGGVYGRYENGSLIVTGVAGYSRADIKSQRYTPYGVSMGDTDGSTVFARVDARYNLMSGNTSAGINLAGDFAYSEIDDYQQRGAGAFDLDIVGDSFRSQNWELSAFADHRFQPDAHNRVWFVGGKLGAVLANGEDTASVAARIPGTSAAFEARGPQTGDAGGLAGAYFGIEGAESGISIRIGADNRWIDGEETTQGYARISLTF